MSDSERNDLEDFKISAKKKFGNKTYANLSYKKSFSLTNPDQLQIGVEYKLNRNLSLVGNMDDKGNDIINEGKIQSYLRKAAGLDSDNAEYLASYANALIEFDRVPMAIREFQKLRALGEKSEEVDVSFHLYEAARMLIDSINLKTNFDRSEKFAQQYTPVAIEFAIIGLGFSSVEEAMEYMALGE